MRVAHEATALHPSVPKACAAHSRDDQLAANASRVTSPTVARLRRAPSHTRVHLVSMCDPEPSSLGCSQAGNQAAAVGGWERGVFLISPVFSQRFELFLPAWLTLATMIPRGALPRRVPPVERPSALRSCERRDARPKALGGR